MEYYFVFSYFITILLFFSIFMLIMILKLLTPKPNLNLPPGPKRLPFIGNLHHLAGSNLPHHTLRDLSNKYGPLMHLQLGKIDNIVVSSPEIAEKFLKTHDIIFASRPSLLSTEIGCYGNTDIAFSPYGQYWRQVRKICTLELLSVKRVQSSRAIRKEEASNLLKWISEHEQGSMINVTEKVSMTNYDIMVRTALGKKTDENAAFISIMREGLQLVSVFHVADVYPSLKFLRRIDGSKRKMEKHHRQLDGIIGNIIDDRKRANASKIISIEGEKQEDLLDVLLKFQGDGSSLQLPLTIDNVKAVLLDMFGAGVDTSATVIDWAMAEMLKNPIVLNKAQEEVRQVFDHKGGHVDESYFDELKYLKLVVKETLRMHPPVPLLLPRESREDCMINGYDILVKTRVLVNVWAMGRDPKYWEDAEKFKPERFLEKTVDFKTNGFEYIPFGAGRRICPGIAFGLANVELLLAMFLYHFDWILPHGMKPEGMDMTESFGLVARRKHDLRVIPVVRRPG